ncbi:small-molecule methyltransferase IraA [Rhizobium freirei PRF 81]|uniref:Small-molecule methyltransferase IraA n=1 Tax=Rhizobium freirei PRF 81 TaxID=363754 RepID=N6U2U4_9HYPH|nr:class I SAM-dependent methyltransferase [Rhizobium freirei]ENN84653.1 small-molecule methyltransferase IraA [Rhizobium freirei PRF 81]
MNIGRLYDQSIAHTYDHDERGLLAGARTLGLEQINRHMVADQTRSVLDLAVGTGESLIAIQKAFPDAALHGIDLSEEMLRIAKTKLSFHSIHDDVANAGQHFAPESMNLVLMHFLTTFIDGEDIVSRTAKLLRPQGYYSIVSSTFQAFPRIYSLARMVLPDEFIRDKNKAPENADTIVSFCTKAGLDVVAVEHFTKKVSFANFEDFYSFGMNSGFFAHVLCHLDDSQLAGLARMEGIFPLEDHYSACAVLARRPA